MSDSEEENITLNAEAAEAKRIADEEAATKKAADEAAEAKRIADEEAATKKAADEAATKKAVDEAATKKATNEAATKKAADEAELAEQLLEVVKLNAITNNLWKKGQKTNFESMSHTPNGVLKHEMKKRSEIHQGFMTSLTRSSNKIISQNVSTPQPKKQVVKLSTRQTVFNSGMMFGNRR